MAQFEWDNDALDYLRSRGFAYLADSAERLETLPMRYDSKTRSIEFYHGEHWSKRSIDPGRARYQFNQGHDPGAYWNRDALYSDCGYVILTEGNFDCLACLAPTADPADAFNAVCLHSTANAGALDTIIASDPGAFENKTLYLLLDCDDAGQKATEKLISICVKWGIQAVDISVPMGALFSDCKDPADAHATDAKRFTDALTALTMIHAVPTAPAPDRVRKKQGELGRQIRTDICSIFDLLVNGQNLTTADRAQYCAVCLPALELCISSHWNENGLLTALAKYSKLAENETWSYTGFLSYLDGVGILDRNRALLNEIATESAMIPDLDLNSLVRFHDLTIGKITAFRDMRESVQYLKALCDIDSDYTEQEREISSDFLMRLADVRSVNSGRVYTLPDNDVLARYKYLYHADPSESPDMLAMRNEFDKDIGGLRRGSFSIISGFSGQGKTWTALKWFYDLTVRNPYRGIYFSCEMQGPELFPRLSGFYARDARDDCDPGDIRQRQFFAYNFDDTNILQTIVTQKAINDIDFVIIDYIQFVKFPHRDKFEKNYESLQRFTQELKRVAQAQGIAVIAVAQRMPSTTGGPRNELTDLIGDLGGAKAMANDADLLVTIDTVRTKELANRGYSPEPYEHEKGRVRCAIIAKNRHDKHGKGASVYRFEPVGIQDKARDPDTGKEIDYYANYTSFDWLDIYLETKAN